MSEGQQSGKQGTCQISLLYTVDLFTVALGHVHYVGKAGNAKYLLNVIGDVRYRKTLLAKCSETDQAKPQKRRGNENDPGKIEVKPDIFATFLEMGYMLQ